MFARAAVAVTACADFVVEGAVDFVLLRAENGGEVVGHGCGRCEATVGSREMRVLCGGAKLVVERERDEKSRDAVEDEAKARLIGVGHVRAEESSRRIYNHPNIQHQALSIHSQISCSSMLADKYSRTS